MGNKVLFGFAIILILLGVYWYVDTNTVSDPYASINLIKSKINGRGELQDYDNEIGVTSIDDIGYKMKDGKIQIHYGKIVIIVGKDELKSKDFNRALLDVGIEIKKKKGTYHVYYKGEEIDRWVT